MPALIAIALYLVFIAAMEQFMAPFNVPLFRTAVYGGTAVLLILMVVNPFGV